MVEVTQEDRDAAADFLESWEPGPEMTVVKLARAFTRHRLAALPQWRPIETLPHERGTSFLGCGEDYDSIEYLVVHDWDDLGHRFFNMNSGNYSRPHWVKFWMPLPAPPETQP